jgi:hypothetical protein
MLAALAYKLIDPADTTIKVCVGDRVTGNAGAIYSVAVSGDYTCGG